MAYIRKKSGRWRAEVHVKGRTASSSFDTRQEAAVWAAMKERELGRGGNAIIGGVSFGDAMRKYAREESIRKKGARWEMIRLEKLARDPLADIMLLHLTTQDFQDWIRRQEKLGLTGSSIRRELTLLSAVLKKCRKPWNMMTEKVLDGLEKPKENPPRFRRISEKEIKLVLKALDYDEKSAPETVRQKIACAFLLAIETAMRFSEIFGLELPRVHLKQRYLDLVDTKNGNRRQVPLSPRAVVILKKLIAVLPAGDQRLFGISVKSADPIFRKAVKLTGIEDLHFHDTRHEAITRLAKIYGVLDLARIVGHRDIRNLMIYYNPTIEELAAKLK